MQEEAYLGMSYIATVTIVPYNAPIFAHNITQYEFSLSYNVEYNVTAIVYACGQSSEMITIRQFYGEI